MHWHWGGNRGSTHNDGWRTPNNILGTQDNWLCSFGKNVGDETPGNFTADGATRRTATGGTGNSRLNINTGVYINESSDWALSCVLGYSINRCWNGWFKYNCKYI